MAATVEFTDLEIQSHRRGVREMDDVTLVFVMLGLNAELEGAPGWGKTPKARTFKRLVFTEIATRWIPPDVFGEAFRELGFDEDGDDA